MNRRSFIKRCFAGVAGACAVFVPSKRNTSCPTGNKCDSTCYSYSLCKRNYDEACEEPQEFTKEDIDRIVKNLTA